jgi:hypothetical protein
MTFGPEFYVPVLKVKRGEKAALQLLAPKVQARMLPLFEIVERRAPPGKNRPTLGAHLKNQFRGIEEAVAPFARSFLDCREIESDGPKAAVDVFTTAAGFPTPVTPVTGISRSVDTAAVMSQRKHGVAIRLTVAEFEAGLIPSGLPAFLEMHSLAHEETDLIIDLGAVDKMIAAGVANLAAAFLAEVPNRRRWRTLTVSGCAFPQSMAIVDSSSSEVVERSEWLAWRDGLHKGRGQLDRLPTFSDCAIQHPKGVEGFDPRIMSASASIRIAQLDDWLLVKGVSTDSVPASIQFPQLAKRLVYGDLKAFYAGRQHCDGCAKMFDAANGMPKLGTPEVWRKLGTIHHITRAVEMVSALPLP